MIGMAAVAGLCAQRRGELETVHVRHLDVGDDDVDARRRT